MATLVVTGADGFLGRTLVSAAPGELPGWRVVPIGSPRTGGVDLAAPDAAAALHARIGLDDPASSAVIHAAALVRFDDPQAVVVNAAMALQVATWARERGLGHAVCVSSVSVLPFVSAAAVQPRTLYGLGKLAAEEGWSLLLSADRVATVRIGGIVGWQQAPTLFWNRLLLAAAGCTTERMQISRRESLRNYVTVEQAARCLLRLVAERETGPFVLSGTSSVSTAAFVEALEAFPGARLNVAWNDDGGRDEVVFEPSPTMCPWLEPFSEALATSWMSRPAWAQGLHA